MDAYAAQSIAFEAILCSESRYEKRIDSGSSIVLNHAAHIGHAFINMKIRFPLRALIGQSGIAFDDNGFM